MFMKKKILIWIKNNKEIVILLLLPLVLFNKFLMNFNEMLFPGHDILSVYSPLKEFLVQNAHLLGKIPLWNPYTFAGSPFLAYSESSIFYPLNLLFFVFPINQVFGYIFIISTMLAGLFTYLYATVIKIDKKSALLASVIFMFSGSLTSIIFPGHTFVHSAIVWLPLLLLIYEKAIQKEKLLYASLASLPIALMVLTGFMQMVIYTIAISTLYFYFRYSNEAVIKKSFFYSPKLLFFPLISVTLAFCLSSVQFIPSLELSNLSSRTSGVSYDFASDFSFPPKQIISLVLPHFFGSPWTYWGKGNFWSECAYLGIIPLMLAGLGFFLKKNKYSLFFFILLIFSLLFSFGKYGAIFPFFYEHIPSFNLFRVPARFLYFYSFSIAILAAFGMSYLLESKGRLHSKKIVAFIFYGLLALGALLLGLSLALSKNGYFLYETYILKNSYAVGIDHKILYFLLVKDITLLSLLLSISSGMILLKMFAKIHKRNFFIVIFVLIVFNLWSFGLPFIQTRKAANPPIKKLLEEIKKDRTRYRILDLSGEAIPYTTSMKIESVTGVSPSYLKDYKDFLWLMGPHYKKEYDSILAINKLENKTIAELLNIKYILSKEKIIDQDVMFIKKDSLYLYQRKDTLPRVFSVPDALVIKDKKQLLDLLKSQKYDPKKIVLLDQMPSTPLHNKIGPAEFLFIKYEPDEIVLKGTMKQSGYLFLSEIWYPGWKTYDNGAEIPVLKGNYIFRTLYLQKGDHEIKMVFEPLSYFLGKIISITTVLLFISCLFWHWKLKSKSFNKVSKK